MIFIGKNSLLYYCLQFLLLIPVNKAMSFIGGDNSVFKIFAPVIATGLIIMILAPFIGFINRRLSWTIGKTATR